MPQVKIGPEFFAKAKNDYSDWQWALVREFFQNSIDCGSKEIHVEIRSKGSSTVMTVGNDGKPMTEDIIVNKLLSLGGSGKDFNSGAVGGFGKAKEVLYFCHREYTIESGNSKVEGSGAEYTITKLDKKFPGTVSRIIMDGDFKSQLVEKAKFFAAVAGVNVKFVINGETFENKLRKGAYRRDINCGRVYTNKQMANLVVVRIGGIPMFTCYTKFDGCVVLELNGISSTSLTSNRDGLRYEARCELEGFISDLTTNKRRALRQPTVEYHRYEGSKTVCAGMEKFKTPKSVAALATTLPQEEAGPSIDTAVLAADGSYGHHEVTEHDTIRANKLVDAFIIKNETGRKVPGSYRPDSEHFSKYSYQLANIWSRLMVVMHRIFGHNDEFTVGFIFSDDALAQYEQTAQHGKVYFINPATFEDGRWLQRYSVSLGNREDLNQIAISALHELVHGLGFGDHDEDYASKLTTLAGELLTHTRDLLWCFDPRFGKQQ